MEDVFVAIYPYPLRLRTNNVGKQLLQLEELELGEEVLATFRVFWRKTRNAGLIRWLLPTDQRDRMPSDLPSFDQQRTWWNGRVRSRILDAECLRRGDTVLALLQSLDLRRPHLLEIGCGDGWLCEKLANFGEVTGVDIADVAISGAKRRVPGGIFLAGDFCALDLPASRFDVALTLETFSHVQDQAQFLRKVASVIKPQGHLIMTTQNRVVYRRRSDIFPRGAGQIRQWVTMAELRAMLAPGFDVLRAFTIQPNGHLGFLRIINSAKINTLLSYTISRSTVESIKERAGLGQTLVVLAQRRQDC